MENNLIINETMTIESWDYFSELVIDFKDVCLKGNKKCMCNLFIKGERMCVVKGWNAIKWWRRMFKGMAKEMRSPAGKISGTV